MKYAVQDTSWILQAFSNAILNINCFQKNPSGEKLKTAAMQGGGVFFETPLYLQTRV
jgi:hypothetical protein